MSFLQAVRDHYGEPDPPRPTTTTPAAAGPGGDTPYGIAALTSECETVATAPEGTRNDTLNKAAFRMGRLIAAGHLTHTTARDNLAAAARHSGLRSHEIDATIRSGLTNGTQHPRTITERPHPNNLNWIPTTQPPTRPDVNNDSDQTDTPAHTSWWPRNLETVIDGTHTEAAPTHLTRNDGQALFYTGKINGLIGESESGKTWVALLAVQQALHSGERVLYLDFEDSASGIIQRLRALGVPTSDLARFTYVDPDETLHIAARADLNEVLDTHQPTLIVLDGFNAAMTLLGLDLQSNKDATTFAQALLRPLSKTDATVVYIDHVPKNREQQGKGGIGAQAKRAMTTGCAIRVDVAQEFGRGMTGRLKLTVDKDRAGHVRAASAGAKTAGQAVLDSSADGTRVDMHIEAPDLRTPEERGPWRPTGLMEKVSRFLESGPGPWSKKAIEDAVEGKAEHVRAALTGLIEDGYVARENGPRGALLHRSIQPFRDGELTSSRPRPTSSRDEVKTDIRPRPSSPTLGGDEDEVSRRHPNHNDLVPPDGDEVEPWWQR